MSEKRKIAEEPKRGREHIDNIQDDCREILELGEAALMEVHQVKQMLIGELEVIDDDDAAIQEAKSQSEEDFAFISMTDIDLPHGLIMNGDYG